MLHPTGHRVSKAIGMDQVEPMTPPYPGPQDSGIPCPVDPKPASKACAERRVLVHFLSCLLKCILHFALVCTWCRQWPGEDFFEGCGQSLLLWAMCSHNSVRIPWWCWMEPEVKREAATKSLLPTSFVETALTAISLPSRWRRSLLILPFPGMNFYYNNPVMVLSFT